MRVCRALRLCGLPFDEQVEVAFTFQHGLRVRRIAAHESKRAALTDMGIFRQIFGLGASDLHPESFGR